MSAPKLRRPTILITGNTKDFSRDHKTTKIIKPRDFIDLIIPELPEGER